MKIDIPVTDETLSEILKYAIVYDTSKDAIMRAAVDQALCEGLEKPYLIKIRTSKNIGRDSVRISRDAYDEIEELGIINRASIARYAGACVLQSVERGIVSSYVDDSIEPIGRPPEDSIMGVDGDIWSRPKQSILWKMYEENAWGSGEGDCPLMSDYR